MDFSSDIVDFHAHILPGADHGSDSVGTTLRQLALASSVGVRRIIATPHFYPMTHSAESFLKRREAAFLKLLPHLGDGCPEIVLGAEVLACPGIENMSGIEDLCIAGTKTMLLELPFNDFSAAYKTVAQKLISRGIDIVLAHADRYDPKNIEIMLEAGVRIQLNASAVSGMFIKPSVQKWISDGAVVALGSDIHMIDKVAYKKFIKAGARLHSKNNSAFDYSDLVWNNAKKAKNEP